MTVRFINVDLKHWIWVVPILLLATAMISAHLRTDAYWGDEGSTMRNIGTSPYPTLSLTDIVYHVGVSEWPPAYFMGLLVWGNIVGWAEFSTRTLSLLTAILTVAFTFRLSRDLYSVRTGLISTFLLSCSIYFVFYSHELRGYSHYMLLTVTTLYLYWKIIYRSKPSYRVLVAFILSTILLIYTHYLAIFVAVGIGLYHLLFARKKNNWKVVLFSFVLIAIAYLPWLSIAILNVLGVSTWNDGLTTQILLETFLSSSSNTLWFVSLPLLVASLFICRNRPTAYLWFVNIITVGMALLANTVSPFIFNARHLIGILPILIILIALTLSRLSYRMPLITGSVLVLWLLAGIWLNRDLEYIQSLPGSARSVPIETMHVAQELTNLCFSSDDTMLTYLTYGNTGWDEHVVVYYLLDRENTRNVAFLNYMTRLDTSHPPLDHSTSYEERYQQFIGSSERTWVLIAPFAYSKPEIQQASSLLGDTFDYCSEVYRTSNMKAYLYQNKSEVTCTSPLLSATELSPCRPDLISDALE